MERRKFTREFTLDSVRLIKDRGVSYVQGAQDLAFRRLANHLERDFFLTGRSFSLASRCASYGSVSASASMARSASISLAAAITMSAVCRKPSS
jgi:hypothetical protein